MRFISLLAIVMLAACSSIPEQSYHNSPNLYKTDKFFYTENGWRAYQEAYYGIKKENDPLPSAPPYSVLEYFVGENKSQLEHKNQIENAINQLKLRDNNTYLYVFIHGWNNNALDCFQKNLNRPMITNEYEQCDKARSSDKDVSNAYYDGNDLEVFQTMLYKRQIEMNRAGLSHIKVKGIYVGWNGRASNSKINSVLTVGTTARNAIAVGLETSLGFDLQKLSNTLRPSSRMAIVGHSFGAKVLTEAMIKLNNPINSSNCYAPLGKNTYILTINPAIEAAAFNGMYGDKNLIYNQPLCKTPNWINITSRNDFTIKTFYPIGSVLFGISRHKGEGDWQTIGHNGAYVTHDFDIENYNHSQFTREQLLALQPYYAPPSHLKGDVKLNALPVTHFVHYLKLFSSSIKKSDGKECGFYPVIFPKSINDDKGVYLFSFNRRETANRAKIWNTITDKSVISGANNKDSITNFSLHNAFSQTNPLRMFDAFVWQEKLKPTFSAETNTTAIELVRNNVTNKSSFDAHLENCFAK